MLMKAHRLRAAYAALVLTTWAGQAAAHGDHDHGRETFAAGEPGSPTRPAKVLAVTLEEKPDGSMTVTPAHLEVKRGTQIRFEIKNAGKATHEFMLGTLTDNAAHKLEMRKNPEMEHDDPNGKTIEAGGMAQILWRFSKVGTFEYACLLPGHYEAGMHGLVDVKP